MIGILLDSHTVDTASHVNDMMDTHFTLKDVIYIVTLIIGVVMGWSRIENKTNGNKVAIAMFKETVEKEFNVIKLRIDKTQERQEKLQSNNLAEFKQINEKLSKILGFLEK